MRRILLSCTLLALLALPAATSARASAHRVKPGYVVIRKALDDGGVNGRPAVTVRLVQGFVLGRVSQEARIDVYHLQSAGGQAQVKGTDVFTKPVSWHDFPGKEYTGSNVRFRAIGGLYRVVVRGSGIYLFAGGQGHVRLRGSSYNRAADGEFSVNGSPFGSMPTRPLTRKLGGG
jgi:hypothetical protein